MNCFFDKDWHFPFQFHVNRKEVILSVLPVSIPHMGWPGLLGYSDELLGLGDTWLCSWAWLPGYRLGLTVRILGYRF